MSPEMKKQLKEIVGFILAFGVLEAGVCAILSGVLDAPFLRCLAGTAAGCAVSALSMVMLAFGIEKSVAKGEKGAQATMGGGYMLRLAVIAVYVFAVIKLPGVFNIWAALVPLVFPRLAVMAINIKNNKKQQGGGDK